MSPELISIRNQYIESKKESRSFWRNLGGNIKAGFGWAKESIHQGKILSHQERIAAGFETPDERMKRLAAVYEGGRNEFIIEETFAEIPPPNTLVPESIFDYRAQLGEFAAEKLTHEIKEFNQAELESNRHDHHDRWYHQYAQFYRNPWTRAGVGLGLNLAGGLAAGMGLIPVSATLFSLRRALGTVGTEGTIHAVEDYLSYTTGVKSKSYASRITSEHRAFTTDDERKTLTADITHSLGFLSEDRIRKNKDYGRTPAHQDHNGPDNHNGHNNHNTHQDHGHNEGHGHGGHQEPTGPTTEEFLLESYQERMKDVFREALTGQPENYAEVLRNTLQSFDKSITYQNHALVTDRRTGALRWIGGFFAADALTHFLSPDKFGPFPSLHDSGARPGWWVSGWPGWWWEHNGLPPADTVSPTIPTSSPLPSDYITMNYQNWDSAKGLPSAFGWGHNAIAQHLFNLDLNNAAQNFQYHQIIDANPVKYNSIAHELAQNHLHALNPTHFATTDGFQPNTDMKIFKPDVLTQYIKDLAIKY